MPPMMFNTKRLSLAKRQLFKVNIGGNEHNPQINGNSNEIGFYGPPPPQQEQSTLVRQTFTQAGKLLEAGTSLITAPVKWLEHMQHNWLTYLVCITILIVCILIIYYCIRRKTSYAAYSSFVPTNLSAMIMDEAMKLASLRHNIRDK